MYQKYYTFQRYILFGYFTITIVKGDHYTKWNPVTISNAKLVGITSEVYANDFVNCILKCSRNYSCNIACFDDQSFVCKFSNVIVSTSYVEEDTQDVQNCYTLRGNDLAFNKTIYATPVDPGATNRVKDNLKDGYYAHDLDTCYRSKIVVRPWLVIDLGSEQKIKKISHICQPNGYASRHCNPVEIRVGHYLETSGNFGNYQFVKQFTSSSSAGQEYEFELSDVTARYVSYQIIKSVEESLQFCYIEINGGY